MGKATLLSSKLLSAVWSNSNTHVSNTKILVLTSTDFFLAGEGAGVLFFAVALVLLLSAGLGACGVAMKRIEAPHRQ